MKIDPALIKWLETEIDNMEHGEAGIIFIIHNGQIKRYKKILEIKKQIEVDNNKDV